ncbi:hypothetical protein [Nautilia lithotrophica]
MASCEVMKSLIEDVFVPLNNYYNQNIHSDSSFHRLFGIYKIALLPFYNDEENYNVEMQKLLKIYSNKSLILDKETKSFFEMFLLLYINWLRKNNHNVLNKLYELFEIEKFVEINNFNNVILNIDDMNIITPNELLSSEGIDKDHLIDLKELMNEYFILSGDDQLINDVYIESFINFIKELNTFLEYYDEFAFLRLLFEKIMKIVKKIDYTNLNEDISKEIKITIDETMILIKKWLKEVFEEKKQININYIDALILSLIVRLEICIK